VETSVSNLRPLSLSLLIYKGTPMNTKIHDLKNQLKFLGFEHVDKSFNSMFTTQQRGKKEADMDLLMYFLRPIMMRHSQEQKYRGTSTTLMSLPPKVSHYLESIFLFREFYCVSFL